jgi:hypothetical protein
MKITEPWGANLREFLIAMFQHDIVWKPRNPGDTPPF